MEVFEYETNKNMVKKLFPEREPEDIGLLKCYIRQPGPGCTCPGHLKGPQVSNRWM